MKNFYCLMWLLLLLCTCNAAINYWVGSVNSDGNNPANWSLNRLTGNDTLQFTTLSSLPCSLTTSMSCNEFWFNAGNNTVFKQNGFTLTVHNICYLDRYNTTGSAEFNGSLVLDSNCSLTMYRKGTTNLYTSNLFLNATGNNTIYLHTYTFPFKKISCSYPNKTTTFANGTGNEEFNLFVNDSGLVFNGGAFVNNSSIQVRSSKNNSSCWYGKTTSWTGSGIFQVLITITSYRKNFIPNINATMTYLIINTSGEFGSGLYLDSCNVNGSVAFYTGAPNTKIICRKKINATTIVYGSYNAAQNAKIHFYDGVDCKVFRKEVSFNGSNEIIVYNSSMKIDSVFTLSSATIKEDQATYYFKNTSITTSNNKLNKVVLNHTSGSVVAVDSVVCRLLKNTYNQNRTGTWKFCGIDRINPRYVKKGQSLNIYGSWDTTGLIFKLDTFTLPIDSKNDTSAIVTVPNNDTIYNTRRSVIVNQSTLSDTLFYGFCGAQVSTSRNNNLGPSLKLW